MDANYEGALAEFAIAQRLAPSNANIGLLVAAIHRRRGHWEECLAGLEQSQRLDPENPNIVRNIVFTNSALRRWPEATRAAQRWRAMSPDSLVARIQMAYLDFQWKGETTSFAATLAEIPVATTLTASSLPAAGMER